MKDPYQAPESGIAALVEAEPSRFFRVARVFRGLLALCILFSGMKMAFNESLGLKIQCGVAMFYVLLAYLAWVGKRRVYYGFLILLGILLAFGVYWVLVLLDELVAFQEGLGLSVSKWKLMVQTLWFPVLSFICAMSVLILESFPSSSRKS